MNPKWMIPVLAAALLVGPATVWLLAQDPPPRAGAPLTDQQLQKIRPIIRGTQAKTARLQTRLGECQRELAALYAHYDLDEAAVRKLQDEIVELQRQLLTNHHRMQEGLRATVDAAQFERLRRRLEQAIPPNRPDAPRRAVDSDTPQPLQP